MIIGATVTSGPCIRLRSPAILFGYNKLTDYLTVENCQMINTNSPIGRVIFIFKDLDWQQVY